MIIFGESVFVLIFLVITLIIAFILSRAYHTRYVLSEDSRIIYDVIKKHKINLYFIKEIKNLHPF